MGILFSGTQNKKKKTGLLFDDNNFNLSPTLSGEEKYQQSLENRISNYETRFNAIGATPPEPEKKTNFLLKALDVMDRPRNALVNAIQDVNSGENGFMQGLSEGFTGKEHAYVSDLLPGIKNKYVRGGVGFVGDVLLDPLTYVTMGAAGAAKGAATQGGKTFLKFAGQPLADITPVAKGFSRVLQKTGLPDKVGPIFNTKYIRRAATSPEEMPGVEAARDIIHSVPGAVKGEQQIALDNLTNRWKGVSPEAARQASHLVEAPNLPQVETRFSAIPNQALETKRQELVSKLEILNRYPTETPRIAEQRKLIQADINNINKELQQRLIRNAAPEAKVAAQFARRLTEETAAKDIAAGVEFGELPNYIKHLYKDPPERVMQVLNQWQKERRRLNPKAGFQKERAIPTIAEAKRLGLTPIEDVRILTTVRELEGIQQRAVNNMYNRLKTLGDKVVMDADKAPAGWKIPPAKQLEGKAVHPEVARFLDRFNETMNTEEGLRTFLTTLNQVQNFWKGLVTAPSPAFHARNVIGNLWNNFLGGVVNPKMYALAASIQKGHDVKLVIGEKTYTGKEIMDIFRRQGLEGFGFFRGESTQRLTDKATDAFNPKGSLKGELIRGKWISAGRRVGDAIETNAKLTHFIDRLYKGATPEQAADSARKYLFDYSDLTTTERAIRNFIPFYTFTRKNLPLQMQSLFTQPGKMTALNKLVGNMTSATGTENSPMPEWMESEMAIPAIVGKDGNVQYLTLDLPLNQLNMFGGGETLKNAVGMLSPLIKAPIELANNRQIFNGQQIEEYPGAQADYGNVKLPAKVAYGLNQLGAIPRIAADIYGSFVNQPDNQDGIPERPKQMPILGGFLREVNPERQKLFEIMDRERQLADYRRYLEEVQGVEVPGIMDIEKKIGLPNKKKGRGLLF